MDKNIISYDGALNEVPGILEKYRSSRVLFVTGKASFSNSELCMNLMRSLSAYQIERHSEFDVNPKIEDINKGILLAQKLNPDVIVGIGGGSVLDTAKLIAAFFQSKSDVANVVVNGVAKEPRTVKLVLIPSTAGSGSEATHFAVIYINGEKYSYATHELLPDDVVLDARLTHSAPKHLTAVTAFDAFSQAIESYWATGSTEESQSFSEKSIRLILEVFNELIATPTPSARSKMMLASYYAGRAINISKTTAPHALSYAITMKYGIAHGHAVALTLPLFVEYNSMANIDKLNPGIDKAEYLQRYANLLTLLSVSSSAEARNKISEMMQFAGLETKLSEIGVQHESEISALVKSVNVERMSNNPMSVSETELFNLISNIY